MRQTQGFTIVELLITTLIFAVVLIGFYAALLSGQSAWSTTDTQIRLQEGLRETLQRVGAELEESGSDKDGVMQITISDNAGTNSSDILTFSVPMCVCSNTSMDANGDVTNWGAPVTWGKTNCPGDVTRNNDGTVSICHLTTNPDTQTDTNIDPATLDSHLSHGDWLGVCTPCSVSNNKTVRYLIDANSRLLRRVLNSVGTVVREDIMASNVNNFQAVLSADQNIVALTVTALSSTDQKRQISISRSLNVHLRNRG